MNRTRALWPAVAIVAVLGSCRGGCHRGDDRAATVEGRLALFPAATRIVASIDVSKLRASPAAAKLIAQAKQNPGDQREIDDFAKRTGFDPLRQLNSVTVAFPEEARALADRVTSSIRDAKKNPQVLLLGLGPYLDGVSASAADRGFDLHAGLSEAAFDDLITRLGGLVALARTGGSPFTPPTFNR